MGKLPGRRVRPCLEELEPRALPSVSAAGPLPDIQMTGATTHDSRTVSVDYNISGADATGSPLTFDVYRSANYDSIAGGQLIGSSTLPASDSADLSAGSHQNVQLALTDPSGNPVKALTPNTALPYIVVVANPNGTVPESDQGNDTNNTASFETHVLGAVSHGLHFDLRGKVPAWETQLASILPQKDGYQAVIAFNWVLKSIIPLPGLATQAGDQLAQQVTAEANSLAAQHPGDVVDVNFIGHSRGGGVISRALQDLNGTSDPALQGGYLQMTLLDPHPASNRFSQSGFVPLLPSSDGAALGVFVFQALARDPQVVVPPDVKQVYLFYERTPAGQIFPTPFEGLINLWGDTPTEINNQSGVPIQSENLTSVRAPGVGLIGHYEVPVWYVLNVADTGRTFNYFG
jgi:hypothetical protein